MLLKYSFKAGPNIRALGTAGGSVMNIGLSINGCTHTRLQLLQRIDVIQSEPLFLFLHQEEDKIR